MSDELARARVLASSVRYSADKERASTFEGTAPLGLIKDYAAQNALRITKEVTPALHSRLAQVYQRLEVPVQAIDAYVYCSPGIQAECYAGFESECVIRFSSGLVDILDADEFAFVAGHEIGHFLLGHGNASNQSSVSSAEHYMQQRAQEVSVDRVGLLACKSLDVAIRALMKTISGLTSTHLRFDVGTFVAQLRQPQSELSDNRTATHPSILVRCRALLWFSMSDVFTSTGQHWSKDERLKLDRRVEADFAAYVDGPVRRHIDSVKKEFAMWSTALAMAGDGLFSSDEQESFASTYGAETLAKLRNLLHGLPKAGVRDTLTSRLQAARNELAELIPESVEDETARLQRFTRQQ